MADLGHLSWCLDDETLVILDRARGQFHAMDGATGRRFLEVANGQRDDDLLRDLESAGLLPGPDQIDAPSRPLALPGLAMPVKTLVQSRRRLKRLGFHATLGWARAHDPGPAIADPLDRFRLAERLLPSALGDLDCLPRSLALWAYLRHGGRSPTLRIGIKRFPFTAHAWVELDGAPVLEDEAADRLPSFREIYSEASPGLR